MIVGHLPAGYLAGVLAQRAGAAPALAWGILVGAVLPDIDMLWFWFVDRGAVHHHTYLTHRPIVWALVAVAGLAFRSRAMVGVGLGGLLHMVLDSIAGAIAWGWPYTGASAPFVVVPATQSHWVLSFMSHWTFLLEIALVLVACAVFFTQRRRG